MQLPRLIVFDVDGTLLRSDDTISPRTREILRRGRAAGIHLGLSSGRSAFGLRRLLQLLDVESDGVVLIGLNGTEVVSAQTGEVLWDRPMPADDYRALVGHIQGFDVTLMVSSCGRLHVEDPEGFYVPEELAANGEELVVLQDLRELTAPPYKIVMSAQAEYLAEHHRTISEPFHDRFEFSFSMPIYFEATRLGTDKGSTLVDYCTDQAIPLSDVMAFGDNYNDLGMLREAGFAVAMANGVPEAKAVAQAVTTATNNADGVAGFLEEHLGL